MPLLPLRFQKLSSNEIVFTDDAGRAFVATEAFLRRYACDELNGRDYDFLAAQGMFYTSENDLQYIGALAEMATRFTRSKSLEYFIVVPTLRCDLKCNYCQVSRVNSDQTGFDWSTETFEATWDFIDHNAENSVQIEFQGGEPLLRIDLLDELINRCNQRFAETRFVICTNLSRLDQEVRELFLRENVFISTSLDGPRVTHKANRTVSDEATDQFFANLKAVVNELGPDKVSALPTIDYRNPPSPEALLDAFAQFGLWSIFLRPISFHGFARKTFQGLRDEARQWNSYYSRFIDHLIERNANSHEIFEEYYLTIALKRCLQGGHNDHVDLRNPNPYGRDYLVIDFDGQIYPTDEARMLTRSAIADLSIGSVTSGITKQSTLDALNGEALNNFDPDCIHCAFQPACGVDIIDDLARYGRRDLPRPHTFFCQRQTHLFETAWGLLLSDTQEIRRSVCAWLSIPYTDEPLVAHYD